MKNIIILFVLFFLQSKILAQVVNTVANPYPKTISVTGTADMQVIPDLIYVNITLREYQKRGEPKKQLEDIKSTFIGFCREVGLPDSMMSVSSYTGYSDYYFYKRKSRRSIDLMDQIVYQLTFSKVSHMDALIEKLDEEATASFTIVDVSHTKIKEYRKQLKIAAVKAAKEKGQYLTEAIGEKLGAAITVVEPQDAQLPNTRSNVLISNTSLFNKEKKGFENFSDRLSGIDIKKLTIAYSVDVVFALQ